MTVVISFVLLLGNLYRQYFPVIVLLSVLPYLLLFLDKRYRECFYGLIWLGAALGVQIFFLHHMSSSVLDSLFLLLVMVILRMAPGLVMGRYSLITTTMSDLVASLQAMKLPDVLIIPISVMFRFFYTVKEDYRYIREAMYLHGLTWKNYFREPMKMLEYQLVPLLMCLSRTADDVAISAMTRGMVVGRKRTTISETRLRFWDYLLIGLMLGVLLLDIWSRYA